MVTIRVIRHGDKYGLQSQFENHVYLVSPKFKPEVIAKMVKRDIEALKGMKEDYVLTGCPNAIRLSIGLPALKGRPRIFDKSVTLPVLEVSVQTKQDLIDRARHAGMTFPEIRRLAYEKLLAEPLTLPEDHAILGKKNLENPSHT